MEQMLLSEYLDALKAQGTSSRETICVVCPQCQTVQNARDLIEAGAGKTFEDIEGFLGFSCVGRWTGAGSPKKDQKGGGCNWTLGGLFSCHTLEVITPDGEKNPRFRPATKEEAVIHNNQ